MFFCDLTTTFLCQFICQISPNFRAEVKTQWPGQDELFATPFYLTKKPWKKYINRPMLIEVLLPTNLETKNILRPTSTNCQIATCNIFSKSLTSADIFQHILEYKYPLSKTLPYHMIWIAQISSNHQISKRNYSTVTWSRSQQTARFVPVFSTTLDFLGLQWVAA